uniref:Uncharacterized protein n=1 Tax=Cacopsylla melanoneura TaxID=428564 RepID=A0A8D9A9F0_9HEMI
MENSRELFHESINQTTRNQPSITSPSLFGSNIVEIEIIVLLFCNKLVSNLLSHTRFLFKTKQQFQTMFIDECVFLSVIALSMLQVTTDARYLIARDPRNNQVYIPIFRWASDIFRDYIFDYAALVPVYDTSPSQHLLQSNHSPFYDLQISPADRVRFEKGIPSTLSGLHANYLERIQQGSDGKDSSSMDAIHTHEGGILQHLTMLSSQPQTGATPSATTPPQTSTTASQSAAAPLQASSSPPKTPTMEPQNTSPSNQTSTLTPEKTNSNGQGSVPQTVPSIPQTVSSTPQNTSATR